MTRSIPFPEGDEKPQRRAPSPKIAKPALNIIHLVPLNPESAKNPRRGHITAREIEKANKVHIISFQLNRQISQCYNETRLLN